MRARVCETTYLDNPRLSEEAVRTLLSFRETNPYYYEVYALGHWGVSGRCVFDAEALSARLEKLERECRRGYFVYQSACKRGCGQGRYGECSISGKCHEYGI